MTVRDELLVDVAALAAALVQPDPPTLLDVRWRLMGPPAAADYAAGHIPGAAFLDLDAELCGPPGQGGRHPLPEPAALQAALRRAGVRAGHPVVVYDDGDATAAARAWWTLRWAGHPAVRVLNGGYAAWLAAGAPVSAEPVGPRDGDFAVVPGGLPVLDAAGAARLASAAGPDKTSPAATSPEAAGPGGAGGGVLIDVRAAERYLGAVEPVDAAAGHIPGAVNLPTGVHTGADGLFRDDADIAAAFAAAGVLPGRPVGAYCGSGITAAHTVLALHLAGRADAALYVGSWSQWITDPRRPVATGAPPAPHVPRGGQAAHGAAPRGAG